MACSGFPYCRDFHNVKAAFFGSDVALCIQWIATFLRTRLFRRIARFGRTLLYLKMSHRGFLKHVLGRFWKDITDDCYLRMIAAIQDPGSALIMQICIIWLKDAKVGLGATASPLTPGLRLTPTCGI
jgi:hypothetical protein